MVLLLKMLHSRDGEFSRGLRLTRSHIYIVLKLLWSLLETCGQQARHEGLISHCSMESAHELSGNGGGSARAGLRPPGDNKHVPGMCPPSLKLR